MSSVVVLVGVLAIVTAQTAVVLRYVDARFDEVGRRLDRIEARLDRLEGLFERVARLEGPRP